MTFLYDRALRHRHIRVNKSDSVWNWYFNTPCKSLRGIFVLIEEEESFKRDTRKFSNPKNENVSVIIEGKPNQLFIQGWKSFEQYEEIWKYFVQGSQKEASVHEIQKYLELQDVNVEEYFTNKYGLWLNFRTIDENHLHGMDRRIEKDSEGITL